MEAAVTRLADVVRACGGARAPGAPAPALGAPALAAAAAWADAAAASGAAARLAAAADAAGCGPALGGKEGVAAGARTPLRAALHGTAADRRALPTIVAAYERRGLGLRKRPREEPPPRSTPSHQVASASAATPTTSSAPSGNSLAARRRRALERKQQREREAAAAAAGTAAADTGEGAGAALAAAGPVTSAGAGASQVDLECALIEDVLASADAADAEAVAAAALAAAVEDATARQQSCSSLADRCRNTAARYLLRQETVRAAAAARLLFRCARRDASTVAKADAPRREPWRLALSACADSSRAGAVSALELCCLRAMAGSGWDDALARAFAAPPRRARGYNARHCAAHADGLAPVQLVGALALEIASPGAAGQEVGETLWWHVNPCACAELAALDEDVAEAYVGELAAVLRAGRTHRLRGEAVRRLASLALRGAWLRDLVCAKVVGCDSLEVAAGVDGGGSGEGEGEGEAAVPAQLRDLLEALRT